MGRFTNATQGVLRGDGLPANASRLSRKVMKFRAPPLGPYRQDAVPSALAGVFKYLSTYPQSDELTAMIEAYRG